MKHKEFGASGDVAVRLIPSFFYKHFNWLLHVRQTHGARAAEGDTFWHQTSCRWLAKVLWPFCATMLHSIWTSNKASSSSTSSSALSSSASSSSSSAKSCQWLPTKLWWYLAPHRLQGTVTPCELWVTVKVFIVEVGSVDMRSPCAEAAKSMAEQQGLGGTHPRGSLGRVQNSVALLHRNLLIIRLGSGPWTWSAAHTARGPMGSRGQWHGYGVPLPRALTTLM